jgi:hypothetical protein
MSMCVTVAAIAQDKLVNADAFDCLTLLSIWTL